MSDRNRRGAWSPSAPEIVGILLIVLGIVFFLGNTSLLQVSWNLVWPLLILGAGALVLVSALRPRDETPSSGAVPRDGVQQLELDLNVGGGVFRLGGGAAQLVETSSNRDDIVTRVDGAGIRRHVRLRQDTAWFPFGGRSYSDWNVRVAPDVPVALALQAGAGTFDVDLSGLRIVDARLSFGAARARLVLPRPVGEVAVKLSSGAASVTIEIPPGVEARVSASGGLLQFQGRNETPSYSTSRDRVSVTISGGVSQVQVV